MARVAPIALLSGGRQAQEVPGGLLRAGALMAPRAATRGRPVGSLHVGRCSGREVVFRGPSRNLSWAEVASSKEGRCWTGHPSLWAVEFTPRTAENGQNRDLLSSSWTKIGPLGHD